ncbi:hypothetical protein M427DRAFT_64697 [Gonapodya prolifera JEL478]|uniref:F-box domain-containing protein n=1 Tax=Gonapodya prolifera (strain JEL478) TaxID=1344416 RepID=A0A138ZXD8_GONPJ|nr:hypothetical protein M427DRAFT_64697 [Gonapodya prolifera JEL478]|eukprot:KXS09158.1 hypothetical protein M427DRAFT_64697 [Gonapodya prolifera JEL478]
MSMPPSTKRLVAPTRVAIRVGTEPEERDLVPDVCDVLDIISSGVLWWECDVEAPDMFALWLRSVAAGRVKELTLTTWPEQGVVWVNRFLQRCSDLTALDVAEPADGDGMESDLDLPERAPPALRHLMIHHLLKPSEYSKVGSYTGLTRLLLSDIVESDHLEALVSLSSLTHLLLPFSSLTWDDGFSTLLTHLGPTLLALDLSRDTDLEETLTLSWIAGIVSHCPNLEQLALDGWSGTSGPDALASAKVLWMGLPHLRALSILAKPLDITPLEKRALEDAMALAGTGGAAAAVSNSNTDSAPARFYFRAVEPVTVAGWDRRNAHERTYWDTANDWELDVQSIDDE